MRALLIGGTGLISTGIVKHLLNRRADVTVFNRSKRENTLPAGVKTMVGDRNAVDEFVNTFKNDRYDVVIDMICFNPDQARASVAAFGGRCEQFIFCSTVCTYGTKVPPTVLVDETFPQEPISGYGRGKLECEQIFMKAHAAGKFKTTIVRPSCTYGPGNPLIDNLESNPASWDRVGKGLPILCTEGGLGLWVYTHRDDCGKLFAYAAGNPKTYGQAYNATRDQNMTWTENIREIARAIGKPAQVLYMPAKWVAAHDPARFGLLREITAFHGAYSSEKAKRDVPEFRCEIDLKTGATETLADIRRRGAWKNGEEDALYNTMVEQALKAGVEPVELTA
ncbi:MAG TPA: NAD-dependent epimerase/dehydratase family protein [Tepidisphaeraceae bacterium]|jgi:nucleoside-diphosphate-sugar epimerase|nr:NAD-dependent epimerase/dehydratase family protein [Tepidisphaeraceae bacterium]